MYPLLVGCFGQIITAQEKSNLIIFLQPTILRDGGAVASVTERKFDQMRVLQLVIDQNGTIKQLPLSGAEGWDGNVSSDYDLMPLNPFISDSEQAPISSPQGFTKVDTPDSGMTTYPLNR